MNKSLIKRLWHTIRLYMIFSSGKRADYLRKHNVFHGIGTGCTIMDRKVPLCSELISLGNNVHLASKVLLVTHDAIHLLLNAAEKSETTFTEKIGCIEIGDNVFIGSNSTILYDVKIGSNVIIGAGSVVNKDIPDNSVAVGIPAHVIGSFDDYVMKRKACVSPPREILPKRHVISRDLEEWCWNDFNRRRI